MKFCVACAQIPVEKSIKSNYEAISRAVEFAINEKADILLTPEGSLSGYTHEFSQEETNDCLKTILRNVKGKLGLALGTCFTEDDGRCYDQIRFYDKNGRLLGFHSKTLLCSTLTDPPEGELQHFAAKPLRTFTFEKVKIGGLICNDMWANPCCTYMPDSHLSQELARMGAKIVFHAVNGGRDASEFSQVVTRNFHESNLRMRAKAAGVWIVTVDNCVPEDIPCSSPGGVIDPNGDWVAQLPPKGERFLVYAINI